MATARLQQLVATIGSPQKHYFTVFFATSASATPTFLHKIQQSDLNPLFIGQDGVFFRKARPSDWGWSHILLLERKDVKLDSSYNAYNLRQAWSITVEADQEFSKDEQYQPEIEAKFGMKRRYGSSIEEPEDLSTKIKHWWRPTTRLWALTFLDYADSDAEDRYKQHLAEMTQECDLQIHLFGNITNTSKPEGRQDTGIRDAEKSDGIAMLSFPGEKEYAKFLLSTEHLELVNGAVKEGMVLTMELRLPPKDQPINRRSWEYGNPYEPYGEDWFG